MTVREPAPISDGGPLADASRTASEAFRRAMVSHPAEMAYATVELHRPVHDDATLLNLLQRAGHVALHCVDGVDWCSITVQASGPPCTAASTGRAALTLDEQQYRLDDGPCLRALRTHQTVSLTCDELARAWPALGAAAGVEGVRRVHSVPLSDRGRPYGSINFYSANEQALSADAVNFVGVLVEYVGSGLADYAAVSAAENQAEQLKQAMTTRAPIEQAKGILMAVHQVCADDAFEMLRQQSQQSNTKLNRLAAEFVAAQSAHPASPVADHTADERPIDYQSAFMSAPAAALMIRPDATVLAANTALARLLVRPPDQLVGLRVFDLAYPADLAKMHRACTELLASPALIGSTAARLMRGDGVAIPVEITTSKVFDAAGELTHMVMYLRHSA